MSGWNAYPAKLVGTGKCDGGCIIGLDGGVWGKTKLEITVAEGKALAGGFTTPSTIQGGGFSIAGRKQFCIKADGECVMGKDKGNGKKGVCCYKAKTCIIVGSYDESMTPGNCASAVFDICEYLKQSNC